MKSSGGIYAKIIADSTYDSGPRLTTFEVKFWRPMLAEFNTHAFSRNSASSRAIPFPKRLAEMMVSPWGPAVWRKEQKGMQGGEEIEDLAEMEKIWADAAQAAGRHASDLADAGVHKSIVNRLLEPFLPHTVVVTSTTWENFFEQRCSPLAQDDIRIPAELMLAEYEANTPKVLGPDDWHLPYVGLDDRELAERQWGPGSMVKLAQISAARCAQLSYLTQPTLDPETGEILDPGGKIDVWKDLARYERLMGAAPRHWSPLEHPAVPCRENRQSGVLWIKHGLTETDTGRYDTINLTRRAKTGKLVGWLPMRSIVEANMGEETYR